VNQAERFQLFIYGSTNRLDEAQVESITYGKIASRADQIAPLA
jgi:hypothetical protein